MADIAGDPAKGIVEDGAVVEDHTIMGITMATMGITMAGTPPLNPRKLYARTADGRIMQPKTAKSAKEPNGGLKNTSQECMQMLQ